MRNINTLSSLTGRNILLRLEGGVKYGEDSTVLLLLKAIITSK
jgi:hypothetical protein